MEGDTRSARFRPNRQVLETLRNTRAMGVARRLGTIDMDLVSRLRDGAAVLDGQADHGYIDDVAVHWARTGFRMTEEDKDTSYTRSLKQNVAIAKVTDESGLVSEAYRNTPLAAAVEDWRGVISRYADDLTLTRINFLTGKGHVLEHVDPPDQNMIQCLLAGETVFDFRTRSGRQSYRMKIGEIWWFNTAWPHSTRNDSDDLRLLLHTRGTLKDEILQAPEAEPSEATTN